MSRSSRHKKAPGAPTPEASGNVITVEEMNVMNNATAISVENNVQAATAQVFQFKQMHDVRAVVIDGDPWFYAMDVCSAVGLTDTNKALIGLDDDEKREHEQYSGSGRKPILINESGLYSLILRSRKPEAKAFKKWVTAEVLPAIRKHGMYLHAPAMRPSLTKEHWREVYREVDRLGSSWALGPDSKNWIYNHMRVVFSVARFEDVPDDQFELVMQLLASKAEARKEFIYFIMEVRSWFEKEVLGGGQPWTPAIKAKLTKQLKRQVISPEFHIKVVRTFDSAIQASAANDATLPVERLLPAAADSFDAAKRIAEGLGLEGNQAVLSANRMVKGAIGVDVMQLAGVTHLINEAQELAYTATELGAKFDMSAVSMNKLLAECGLQRNFQYRPGKKRWEVTPDGKPFAVIVDTGKQHSDGAPVQQIRWKESVLDELHKLAQRLQAALPKSASGKI